MPTNNTHFHKYCLQDELLSTSLREAISAKMSALHNELGDGYMEFISTIDGDTLRQLESGLDSNI
jgi:hypothetical protein